MQFNSVSKLGMAALLSVMMAACSSTDTEAPITEDNLAPANTGGAVARPVNPDGLTDAQRLEQERALAKTIFYFEFDRADLSAEDRAALIHHANRLKAQPNTSIRLEGHADERGTREYNLALGERRAQAVERYLQVQGVAGNQMEVISYGEEQPVDRATTETAYSRNRRVEMK